MLTRHRCFGAALTVFTRPGAARELASVVVETAPTAAAQFPSQRKPVGIARASAQHEDSRFANPQPSVLSTAEVSG